MVLEVSSPTLDKLAWKDLISVLPLFLLAKLPILWYQLVLSEILYIIKPI